ncbi:MAG: AAA family ATPase [Muribaculaceae bacterium]|nr:AAA family ATPase [Muribaculaceae bacterium]
MENILRTDREGAERFLASHWVEGIGPAFARKLVERFGEDAVEVLLNRPDEAATVDGIGESRVVKARESLLSLKWEPQLVAFLYSCGLADTFVERILNKYRGWAKDKILHDPYGMVEDVWQLSFFTADKIGSRLGVAKEDTRRIVGALVTAVKHFAEDGHLFARPEEAAAEAARIAEVTPEDAMSRIKDALDSGRLVESRGGLYLPVFYKAEKEGAAKLAELAASGKQTVADENIPERSRFGYKYSPEQREAIRMALENPVAAITGGPGSGKTTVVRGIIEAMEKAGQHVTLAAPTGRATKRLSTLTGKAATTIHRLLGYRQGEGYSRRQIDTDMLIIDEGSMMEQVLFNHLLQALRPGTKVLLVGDVDQLPAIGAGDVMRDMIESGKIPVACLNENFRQSEGSLIASGARAINRGELPMSDPESDFVIIPEPTQKAIHDRILQLVAEELPESRGLEPTDIQVVTPQQIGLLGARRLNTDLQQRLNPEGPELHRGATVMRQGDPVMQTANSREREVYNGEIGRIVEVNPQRQELTVEFTDGRRSTYQRSELGELVLAYATTVHKLQGSEARNIIIPVTMAHRPMLYRNLLYTAVSRATELCVLVGEEDALRYAVENTPANTRNSNFRHRL